MSMDESYNFPRHIRHISAIQVRNLTPFPLRDTVTSTLNQPANPQTSTQDDLDLTVSSARRERKHSGSSAKTLGSSDDRSSIASGATTRRRRSNSIRSTSSKKSFIRPQRRRTMSLELPTVSAAVNQDSSQEGLEKVLNSRLVETFLAVTSIDPPPPPISLPTSPTKAIGLKKNHADSKRGSISSLSNLRTEPMSPRLRATRDSDSPNGRRSSLSRGNTPPASPTPKHVLPNGGIDLTSAGPSRTQTPVPLEQRTPNYLSPVHRPSTNPKFAIDATKNSSGFASWTGTTAGRFKVDLWGKHGPDDCNPSSDKGKQRMQFADDDEEKWQILDNWDVDFNILKPVPKSLLDRPSNFPCNSLLIYLSSGQALYVPGSIFPNPPATPQHDGLPSASSVQVHDSGYNSDPEPETRTFDEQISEESEEPAAPRRRYRKRRPPDLSVEGDVESGPPTAVEHTESLATSSSWSDLFKLVSLQASIADYEASLREIISSTDKLLKADKVTPLKREISQREYGLSQLRSAQEAVDQETISLRVKLDQRKAHLAERRSMLAEARSIPRDMSEGERLVSAEQDRLASLQSHFEPLRTSLFATLLSIYPIELLSPPDLLYTILSVPLPIPLNPQDPAPPLILPKVALDLEDVSTLDAQHIMALRGVTDEDKVATALGYAAHVVQLLASYLGKGLVYPITYVGSRSLIRDGISAMVGPRMFPLFSKGVDTYRFEYGVFLLNKDIELLMSDRDLRAIDIRHTLPNLKNLLLILTSGDFSSVVRKRPSTSNFSLGSASGLASPIVQADKMSLSDEDEGGVISEEPNNQLSASGAVTPTASALSEPSGSSFFGMPSLSGFGFLKRAPSVSTVKGLRKESSSSSPTAYETEVGQDQDGEEDRRTIRGVEATIPGPPVVNGHVDQVQGEEKNAVQSLVVDARTSTPTTL